MKNTELTEQDLAKIFSQKPETKFHNLVTWANRILVFIAIFVIVYFAINFSAFFGNINFWFRSDILAENVIEEEVTGPKMPAPDYAVEGVDFQKIEQIDNNSLSVQSVGIKTPIIWRVPNDSAIINKNLNVGVVHLEGTALPGEKGNIFIAGHSSNYIWTSGQHNTVFSLNNKMVVGDVIHIKYQEKDYLYTVSEKKVVKPTETDVIKSTGRSTLTLSTCWPLGTSLRRLLIVAEQVYPNPEKNIESSYNINIDKIPNSR